MVLPLFFAFVFAITEYGRVQLVSNLLKSACRTAARQGATEGVSNADVRRRIQRMLGAAMDADRIDIVVKDASVLDGNGSLPSTAAGFESLPDVSLDRANSRQLFLVRAAVRYNDIAFVPFSALDNVTIAGQSFMRHE